MSRRVTLLALRAVRALVGHIRAWDSHGRPSTTTLQISAYPSEAEVGQGVVIIEKRHTRIALDWR